MRDPSWQAPSPATDAEPGDALEPRGGPRHGAGPGAQAAVPVRQSAWRSSPAVVIRPRAAALLLPALLAAPPAHAGTADFLAGCMAAADDLDRLPATLATAGYAMVDPADGPQGPAIAQAEQGRRLWSRPRRDAEAFTGLTLAQQGRPFAVCWHVSRPGDSAAVALPALTRRFPPLPGSVETGTEMFYGGFQQWRARVGTNEVTLGVSWALQGQPGMGVSMLYVVTPQVQRRAQR